jgi:hypothetical protein
MWITSCIAAERHVRRALRELRRKKHTFYALIVSIAVSGVLVILWSA